MADFDPDQLPEVPNYQLTVPPLTVPGHHAPALDTPLLTMPEMPAWTPTGIGTPASMTTAFGHLADAPPPNLFAPLPAGPAPLQLHGLGPISSSVNPWLADPMGVAGDAQRRMDLLPRIDPGLAAQQTIFHAPEISF